MAEFARSWLSSSCIGASYLASAAVPADAELALEEDAPLDLEAVVPVEGQPTEAQRVEGQRAEGQAAEGQRAEGQPLELARVSREDALVAVLAAPVEGSVAAAYQRKEAAFRAVLAQLPAAECRVLAARLRCVRPGDPLASLFGRMTVDRRGRLLAYLDDARRREAVRAAFAPHAKAGSAAETLVAPALGASASRAGPSAPAFGTAP